jgi:hypothetical protein
MNEAIRAGVEDAFRMLDAFLSVGVRRFSVSRTDIHRMRRDYRVSRNQSAMRLLLPHLVPLCWNLQQNLIVRPEKPLHGVLAQLDDLDAARLERVRSVAFLLMETSPGNYQVWIAIEGGSESIVKQLMSAVGSDPRANCSGRMAGSPNVKPKYAPNFPVVKIVDLQSGRRTSPAELESLQLLCALPVSVRESLPDRGPSQNRGWPDYQQCLAGAPARQDGEPDRSRADYMWCMWALERGNSPWAVSVRLMEVSAKAREEWDRGNRKYVARTVEAARRAE